MSSFYFLLLFVFDTAICAFVFVGSFSPASAYWTIVLIHVIGFSLS
jgi:hypothetical protein